MGPETAPARHAEEHFFFEPASIDGPMYGRLYLPADPLDLGVVVVPPIGRERVRVGQELSVLGRDLAAARFPALRCDYRGEGESAGDFPYSTVTSRVEDTVAAAEELVRRTGVRRVALVGLHLGAVVAALAGRKADAGFLCLCDPVCALKPYVNNLFRAAVLHESQYFGRASTVDELRAAMKSGTAIHIYGFPTAAPLVDELESLDLSETLGGYTGASAILHLASDATPAASTLEAWQTLLGGPSRCMLAPVVMNFSWTTRKRWTPRLKPLNDAIVEWLRGRIHQRYGPGVTVGEGDRG